MYKIITVASDPKSFLSTKTRLVTPDDFSELDELKEAMLKICKEKKGIGLSANQIGSSLRVFLINLDEPKFYINPELEELNGSLLHEEGCLSIPGKGVVINRANSLLLLSDNQEPKMVTGLEAAVAQHEMDHLDGILMTERSFLNNGDRK